MSVYKRPIRSDELYHHGILGMHWGIRRFQNKDGSLTAAGRKRTNNQSQKAMLIEKGHKNNSGLTSSQKKAIGISSAVSLSLGAAIISSAIASKKLNIPVKKHIKTSYNHIYQ